MSNPTPRAEAVPCATDSQETIADSLVFVHCAHTSLSVLESCGMLGRERPLYTRLFPRFRRVVMVSYGGREDLEIAATLLPEMPEHVVSICNERELDPALFLSEVPDRVSRLLSGHRSTLVLTDQHYGGDLAVSITRALRNHGLRAGLLARGGYHWGWFVAREEGADSLAYAQARYLEGELMHAADVVIGTSPRMVFDLAMLHGAPADRFRLVPNYVIVDQPAPRHDQRDPNLILYAGRLHPQKRCDLLMTAAAGLPVQLRDRTRLLMLGSGPEEARLKLLASRLPLKIEFRPRVPHEELIAAMRKCAVYAQCAEYEGHPKTIIEALACGCPTLVTEGPGVSECIIAGTTGLVAPGEKRYVTASLTTLLTDRALAARLGAAAAELTLRSLGFDAIFPVYLQACIDAMANAGSRATMPPAVVRWDQPMLRLSPEAAAAAWHAGLHAYARRLEPTDQAEFVRRLGERIEALGQSAAATAR